MVLRAALPRSGLWPRASALPLRPQFASIADRTISSWRVSAAPMASGNESHNGVDPSMSVNRNVTVPEGVGAVPPGAVHPAPWWQPS